jgi:hypothetical protein
MQDHTLGEACRSLRISRKTLDKWLVRLEIEPKRHPRDWRYWTISDDQLEQIRLARAEMPGMVPPLMRPPAYARGSIIPPASIRPSESQRSASQEPSGVLLGVQVHHVLQQRSRKGNWIYEPLPAGWIPVSTWSDRHGLNDRSVKRQSFSGQLRLPQFEHAPAGMKWKAGSGQPVVDAYRDDQLAEACRVAAEKWPDDFHACEDPVCPCHTIAAGVV